MSPVRTEKRHGTLFFAPLDVLFFRDYRPADAGWNVLGQSVFPLPGVMLGCVRGALFRALGANFKSADEYYEIARGGDREWAIDLLGSRDRAGSLQLYGPLLARSTPPSARDPGTRIVQPLFAMPADLSARKATDDAVDAPSAGQQNYRIAQRKRLRDVPFGPRCYRASAPDNRMRESRSDIAWTSQAHGKSAGRFMLTERGLRAYLRSGDNSELTLQVGDPGDPLQDVDLLVESQLLEREDRYGIARTDRLTAAPQMFYVKRPFRLARDYGFAVQVEIPDESEAERAIHRLHGCVVSLGGRGHRARVHFVERPLLPSELQPTGPIHKAVYITPVPLAAGTSGWPEGMSGVAERLQPVGGFDQGRRRPRPLRQALPAGSVVYADGADCHLAHITASLCKLDENRCNEDLRLARAGFAWAVGQSTS